MIYVVTGVHEGTHYKAHFMELLIISLVQFLCKLVLVFFISSFLSFFFFFFFALNIICTLLIWLDGPAHTE